MRLTTGVSTAYGLGSFIRVGENLIGFYLLFYLTTEVGLPAGTAGLISGASVLLGALLSPMIGVVSDRSRCRWGRRRPFLLIAGVPTMALLALLFTKVDFGGATSTYYFVVAAAYIIAYYCFLVPYDALGAVMTEDAGRRATIRAICTAALYLSVLVGGFLVLQLQTLFAPAYGSATAWTLAVVVSCSLPGVVFALLAWRATRGYESQGAVLDESSVSFKSVGRVLRMRPVIVILVWALIYFFANAVLAGTIVYAAVYVLGLDEGTASTLFLISALATFVSVAPAAFLARRIGKRATLVYAIIFFVIVAGIVLLVGFNGYAQAAVLAGAFGVTNSIALVCSYAMVYDLREVTELRFAQDLTALLVGLFTLLIGVTSSFAPVVIGALLEAAAFDPMSAASPAVASVLVAFLTWVPAGLLLLSVVPLAFWNVNERRHAAIVEELRTARVEVEHASP